MNIESAGKITWAISVHKPAKMIGGDRRLHKIVHAQYEFQKRIKETFKKPFTGQMCLEQSAAVFIQSWVDYLFYNSRFLTDIVCGCLEQTQLILIHYFILKGL